MYIDYGLLQLVKILLAHENLQMRVIEQYAVAIISIIGHVPQKMSRVSLFQIAVSLKRKLYYLFNNWNMSGLTTGRDGYSHVG